MKKYESDLADILANTTQAPVDRVKQAIVLVTATKDIDYLEKYKSGVAYLWNNAMLSSQFFKEAEAEQQSLITKEWLDNMLQTEDEELQSIHSDYLVCLAAHIHDIEDPDTRVQDAEYLLNRLNGITDAKWWLLENTAKAFLKPIYGIKSNGGNPCFHSLESKYQPIELLENYCTKKKMDTMQLIKMGPSIHMAMKLCYGTEKEDNFLYDRATLEQHMRHRFVRHKMLDETLFDIESLSEEEFAPVALALSDQLKLINNS